MFKRVLDLPLFETITIAIVIGMVIDTVTYMSKLNSVIVSTYTTTDNLLMLLSAVIQIFVIPAILAIAIQRAYFKEVIINYDSRIILIFSIIGVLISLDIFLLVIAIVFNGEQDAIESVHTLSDIIIVPIISYIITVGNVLTIIYVIRNSKLKEMKIMKGIK